MYSFLIFYSLFFGAQASATSMMTKTMSLTMTMTLSNTKGNFPASGCIRLFEHFDFGGKQIDVCDTDDFLEGWWNDKVSSACAGRGSRGWTLYQHAKFEGSAITLNQGQCISNFGKVNFNDKLSSVKRIQAALCTNKITVKQQYFPRNGCIRLYEHINYTGRTIDLCSKNQAFNVWSKAKTSSACVGKGDSRWILYEQHHYRGKYVTIQPGQCVEDFRVINFNDMVESLMRQKIKARIRKVRRHPKNNCVRLYEHVNYNGKRVDICGNKPRFVGWWNDRVSSVCAGKGNAHWKLFNDWDFKGRSIKLHPGKCIHNFVKIGFNDKLSSIKKTGKGKRPRGPVLRRPRPKRLPNGNCLRIYEHINFGGRHLSFNKSQKVLKGWWNDKVSSACAGRGSQYWKLFEHQNFKGRHVKVYPGKCLADFRKRNFNDKLSSVRRRMVPKRPLRKNCLTIYEHINKKGKKMRLCKNTAKMVGWWNDKISSACADKSIVLWIIYQHFNYKGKQLKIMPGQCINNFVMKGFNDIASSFRKFRAKPRKPHRKGLRSHCIRVFEHVQYKGKFIDHCQNNKAFKGWWNDKASSVCVGRKFSWKIFEHFNWGGRNILVKKGRCIENLVKLNFNDKLSGVKKIPNPVRPPRPTPPVVNNPAPSNPPSPPSPPVVNNPAPSNPPSPPSPPVVNNPAPSNPPSPPAPPVNNPPPTTNPPTSNGAPTWPPIEDEDDELGDCPPVPKDDTPDLIRPPRRMPVKKEYPAKNCIRLWENDNYQGEYEDVCQTVPDFKEKSESACVGPGEAAYILANATDFKGQSSVIIDEYECFKLAEINFGGSKTKAIRQVFPKSPTQLGLLS